MPCFQTTPHVNSFKKNWIPFLLKQTWRWSVHFSLIWMKRKTLHVNVYAWNTCIAHWRNSILPLQTWTRAFAHWRGSWQVILPYFRLYLLSRERNRIWTTSLRGCCKCLSPRKDVHEKGLQLENNSFDIDRCIVPFHENFSLISVPQSVRSLTFKKKFYCI